MTCWQKIKTLLTVLPSLICIIAISAWAENQDGTPIVTQGKRVSIEYRIKLENGNQVVPESVDEPWPTADFTCGKHEVIRGLERSLIGLKVGDTKRIKVEPEEGFQEFPQQTVEIEKNKVPKEAQKVGAQLKGTAPDGKEVEARVVEVRDKTIVLKAKGQLTGTRSFINQLAGKRFFVDVKVLRIEDGSK